MTNKNFDKLMEKPALTNLEAFDCGKDEAIRQFATGEFIKSDIAEKFYKEAYEKGYQDAVIENKGFNNPCARCGYNNH